MKLIPVALALVILNSPACYSSDQGTKPNAPKEASDQGYRYWKSQKGELLLAKYERSDFKEGKVWLKKWDNFEIAVVPFLSLVNEDIEEIGYLELKALGDDVAAFRARSPKCIKLYFSVLQTLSETEKLLKDIDFGYVYYIDTNEEIESGSVFYVVGDQYSYTSVSGNYTKVPKITLDPKPVLDDLFGPIDAKLSAPEVQKRFQDWFGTKKAKSGL